MIKNFEDYTYDLTEAEKKILYYLVPMLENAIGKDRALTNEQILRQLAISGMKSTSPRIRAIIHQIRVRRLVQNLIATSKGYYVATTYKEIGEYITSLRDREKSIRQIRESFENPKLFS